MSSFMDATLTRAEMKQIKGQGYWNCVTSGSYSNKIGGKSTSESFQSTGNCALATQSMCETQLKSMCGKNWGLTECTSSCTWYS